MRQSAMLVLMTLVVVMCVAGRLLPHPHNVTPMAAAGLVLAAFLGASRFGMTAAMLAMVVALAISDLVLGGYEPGAMVMNYVAFCSIVPIAWFLRKQRSAARVATCSLAASTLFFLVSNLGVWGFTGMYEGNVAGLMACYAAGLPFFKLMLCGDLAFSGLMFGAWHMATQYATRRELQPAPAVAVKN